MFASTSPRSLDIGRATSFIREWRWEERLPQLVDAALWSLVVLAPFAWGGRHDAARYLFALLVAVATFAWLAQTWLSDSKHRRAASPYWTPALAIPLLAIAWVMLQLIPLPPAVIELLSSRTAELLPLWGSDNAGELLGQAGWATLSLNPHATQGALGMLLCYSLLFFVALQRFKSIGDIVTLLRWIGTAAVAMAVFGLLQFYTSDGLFFWVYEHPYRQANDFVCGSFINRNHFASFLAMGAVAIACRLMLFPSPTQSHPSGSQSRSKPLSTASKQALLWTCLLAMVALALFMSFSRGGVAAAMVGAIVLAVVYWRGQLWGGRQLGYLLLMLLLLGAGLSLYTDSRLSNRLDDLTSGSIAELDRSGGRRLIWQANWQAISEGGIAGSGAGTHRDIYPVYFSHSWPTVFTHAENGYLQMATEMGLPGVLLLLSTFGVALVWAVRAWRRCELREEIACLGAILAALAVSAAHSVVDFVWYIPATMTLVVLLLAALCRLANLKSPQASSSTETIPSGQWELSLTLAGASVVMLVLLSGPALASRAWDRYYTQSARHELFQQDSYKELVATGDPSCLRRGSIFLQAKAEALQQVLRSDPHSAGAHQRLARVYLQAFDARSEARENRMGLAQLQAAVATGGFDSPQAVNEWLRRAVGDDFHLLVAARQHARRAVQLAPLDGMGYVCLANLSFLEQQSEDQARAYLTQATTVRPYSGDILFEAGKHYLIAGDLETAIHYWTRCYHQPGQHRLLVVASLAGRIPAADFLDMFQPNWQTLPAIWKRYVASGQETDLDALLVYAEAATNQYQPASGEPATAYVWGWLATMHRDRGDTEQELHCLERAMAENRSLYAIRQAWALALYRSERYAEAEPHFRWCLARHPENQGMRKTLRLALDARAKQQSPTFRRHH